MPIIHPSLVGAEVAAEVGEKEAVVGGGGIQGEEEGRLHDRVQRRAGCGRGRGRRGLVHRPDGHPRGEEGQEGVVRVDVAEVRVQRVERDEVLRLGHCLDWCCSLRNPMPSGT